MWIRRHWSACICLTGSGGSSEQPCCSSIGCIYCCWGLLLAVAVLFIAAFAQEKMGNFTINLNRLELYRKGISIADNGDFDGATARLVANTVQDATNISIDDIPADVDGVDADTMARIIWRILTMSATRARRIWLYRFDHTGFVCEGS